MTTTCAMMRIDPGGYFLARPESVGTSVEELMKFEFGVIDERRSRVIIDNLSNAAIGLRMALPQGNC